MDNLLANKEDFFEDTEYQEDENCYSEIISKYRELEVECDRILDKIRKKT